MYSYANLKRKDTNGIHTLASSWPKLLFKKTCRKECQEKKITECNCFDQTCHVVAFLTAWSHCTVHTELGSQVRLMLEVSTNQIISHL